MMWIAVAACYVALGTALVSLAGDRPSTPSVPIASPSPLPPEPARGTTEDTTAMEAGGYVSIELPARRLRGHMRHDVDLEARNLVVVLDLLCGREDPLSPKSPHSDQRRD